MEVDEQPMRKIARIKVVFITILITTQKKSPVDDGAFLVT